MTFELNLDITFVDRRLELLLIPGVYLLKIGGV